jgi:TonB family protein
MKNFILLALIFFVQIAYAQEKTNLSEAEKLKSEALKFYEQKKYEEALKLARQVLQINEKEFGEQSLEAANALADIANIEIADGKLSNGAKTMQQAISIYESKNDLKKENGLALAIMFETVGFLRYKDDKPEQALIWYSRALEIKEKYMGAQSLETSKTLWNLANMSVISGDYQGALGYYEKVLKIRGNNIDLVGYDEVSDVLQRYQCIASKTGNSQKASRLINETQIKIERKFKQSVADGGVVNGKAKKLVKPRYPARAGAARLSGAVQVQVTIDETGKVIFACSISGNSVFYGEAEDAALKSKFDLTLVNGKPVKVTGIIVYNFIP